ncbi:MAG: hypothetical protein ACKPKO_01545, partial [Candidatus Fonsibacter sp.]
LRPFELDGIHPHNVQIRRPSDLTRPSANYEIILRHPRFRADSQAEWRGTHLQHRGAQTLDEVNYIMEPRPDKELHIYIHDEAPKTTPFNLQAPRGYSDIITKKALEQNTGLVQRFEIDGDNPRLREEWTPAVAIASKACREVRTYQQDEIVRTTGFLDEFDSNTSELTVQDTITSLCLLEIVLEDMRSSKKRGHTRKDHVPQLADFGDQTSPRTP